MILPAGTYEVYFLYLNGSVTVNIPGVSQQSSALSQLSIPENFIASAAGQTQINTDWDAVTNAAGYQLEYSLNGSTGWTILASLGSGTTAYNHTGLTAGQTIYYRVKATGDNISYSESQYATTNATTTNVGDVTAPTFSFSPTSGVTTWTVNKPVVITADEPIRNTNGTALNNANIASVLTLKETNSSGTNIPFTATIDDTKTVVTITPTSIYGANQLVYVAINNVEDINGNEVTVAQSSTFTTTEFSYLNGTSNRLQFGNILNSVFAANDAYFELEITVNQLVMSGPRVLFGKLSASDNQRSFAWFTQGTDVFFVWYGSGNGHDSRQIKWTNVMTSGEHTLTLIYDGSIDTNNGLDRVVLEIDTIVQGSKTLDFIDEDLSSIFSGTAQLSIGIYVSAGGSPVGSGYFTEQAKDAIIRSAGAVVELNIPILRTGEDTSGNNRDGTWV
jgi:ribosomal protein L14